ncbi:protein kinase [Cryptosporangium sp. NPDC048952]|uniref:serine/threonine-protein kinase n=1 Tax=Cryptosporangium sp. NPDC048952 TaxID=3363961 RepID=UPI00371E74DE
MADTQQTVLAGRYRLVDQLGRGGMGTVWRAHDELLDRDVAVKEVLLPPGVDDETRDDLMERTKREARAAARLSHPNVVTVFDVVEVEGRPWIVMELVKARGLNQIVRDEGSLVPERVAEIGVQLLNALGVAHASGIFHRDVKPSNVLVSDNGRVVLADFGIASVQGDPAMTRSGLILGSPSYIAPERARGLPAGPASDLWAVGATLYTAVEGRPPYDRDGIVPILTAAAMEDPDPFVKAGPIAPVLTALLQREPSKRPSVEEARLALRQISLAALPPAPERPRRRNLSATAVLPATDPAQEKPSRRAGAAKPVSPAAGGIAAGGAAIAAGGAAAAPGTPVSGTPVSGAPVSGAPAASAPVSGAPAASAPVSGGPAASAPVSGAPATAAPVSGGPVSGAPVSGAVSGAPATDAAAGAPATDAAVSGAGAPTSGAAAGAAAVEPASPAATGAAAGSGVAGPATPAQRTPPEEAAVSPAPVAAGLPESGPESVSPAPVGFASEPGTKTPRRAAFPPDGDTPVPATYGSKSSGRGRLIGVIAALLVVAVVVAGVVYALANRSDTDNTADPTPSASAPAPSSAAPSSAAPSASPSAAPSTSPSAPVSPSASANTGGSSPIPAGWRKYTGPGGYTIGVPNGWSTSSSGEGIRVNGNNGFFLLIQSSNSPKQDAKADWEQQEQARRGSLPGYQRISIETVQYRNYATAADWQFFLNRGGGQVHVLNRGFVTSPTKAYGFWFEAPAGQWDKAYRTYFQTFANTFVPPQGS